MSLGSRIITRGPVVTVASLPTPREPLCFLYPQLLKFAPATARVLTYPGRSRLSRTPSRRYATQCAPKSQAATERDARQTYEAETRDQTQDIPPPYYPIVGDHGHTPGEENEASIAAEGTMNLGPKRAPTRSPKLHKTSRVEGSPHKEADRNLKSKVSKALKLEAIREADAAHDRSIRRAYQTARRERTKAWEPDWRVILRCLRKHTPQNDGWFENAISVEVSNDVAKKLFNDADDNVWDIAARFNASVQLADRKTDTGMFNEFTISGSATAIQTAAREVMRMAPDTKLKADPQAFLSTSSDNAADIATVNGDDSLTTDKAHIRHVRSQSRRVVLSTRPEKVSKPTEWTTHTLAEYVSDLTSIRMPSYLHRVLYRKDEDHANEVIKHLREVFASPDCRPLLSRTAFHTAMQYFMNANQIPDARAAFVLMETLGISPDPETFNILLRGAAKQEDLHVYQFVLDLMLRRGVKPNGQTWIAFLRANHNIRIKAYIVTAMKDKGLLSHRSILKDVCEEVVGPEISSSLDQSQTQDDFLRHMDYCYGGHWLTVDSGNRVLHALGGRLLISRCWDLLEVMVSRGIQPNQVSVRTILNNCRQFANIEGALETMRIVPSLFDYVPDEHAYNALFELAWRTECFNLSRVVWRYACLNAGTTKRMRMLVVQSLLHEAPIPTARKHSVWRRQAGRLTVGTVDIHPVSKASEQLGSLESDSAATEAVTTKHTPPSLLSWWKMKAKKHVELDHDIFRRFLPLRPFSEMLIEAWKRDCEWQQAWETVPRENLEWKLQRAITIPLRSSSCSNPVDLEWK